jgi:hypothetical protein
VSTGRVISSCEVALIRRRSHNPSP